jgi:thiaminase/transcriptional activator TenA
LHCQYAGKLGISKEELEAAQPAPTTLAYSHYMLAVAHSGSIAHLLAALLPCLWSYWEIGKELSRIPGSTEHPFYGIWVKMYSSEDFGQLARWAIDLMNQEAVGKNEAELAHLEEIFLNTSRFEYMFWGMADLKQMWPLNA